MSDTWEEIEATRTAIKAMPDDHPDLGPKLHEFGYTLLKQYEEIPDSDILDEAIEHVERAASLMVGHEELPDCLYNLVSLLYDRFADLEELEDLVRATEVLQRTIDITPDDEPDIPSYHYQLGVMTSIKYKETKIAAHLDDAVHAGRKSIALSTQENPQFLEGLASHLKARYDETASPEDLDEGIKVLQKWEHLLSKDDDGEDLPRCLNRLGNLLSDRGFTSHHPSDLDESIRCSRKALDLMSDEPHPEKASTCFNLSIALDRRNTLVPSNDALEESARMAKKAVAVCEDDDLRSSYLINLGDRLLGLFLHTRDHSILNEAIQAMRDAAKYTSETSESSAIACLCHLGGILIIKYDETSHVSALDEAMKLLLQAVENASEEDTETLAASLDHLAAGYRSTFMLNNRMPDLDEAIKASQLAVEKGSKLAKESLPYENEALASYIDNYEIALRTKFGLTQATSDVDASVKFLSTMLSLLPEKHPNRPDFLRVMGRQLYRKYRHDNDVTDLNKAIEASRQAVALLSPGAPYEASLLNNFGTYLAKRYHKIREVNDLEEAIDVARRTVKVTPQTYPYLAAHLMNLGNRLVDRAIEQGKTSLDSADMKEAAGHFQTALDSPHSLPAHRIDAGILALKYNFDEHEGYQTARRIIEIIPQLAQRSFPYALKQRLLSRMYGITRNAAAAALQANAGAAAAVELLELGRGLLGTSLSDLRTDLVDLKEKHPEVAEEYAKLSDKVQNYLGSEHEEEYGQGAPPLVQQKITKTGVIGRVGPHQINRDGKELDELVEKIRGLPEFGDFLRPPSEAEAKAAAESGPIVIINITDFRCDALLVESQQIRSLGLDGISGQKLEIRARAGNLGCPEVLEWLWESIAKPVLDALGYTEAPSGQAWPHIWWIPTGPLAKYPLHAAGYHDRCTGETVLDRVVSSYGSSIRAMIQGRRRLKPSQLPSSVHGRGVRAILVAMEHTPLQPSLPSATQEISALREVFKSISVDWDEPACQKEPVLTSLSNCDIFHFAGHGRTDPKDASQSSLMLEDWQSSPLTVESLLQSNLQKTSPLLAYLSACGTGRTKIETLVDEGFHLISACQLAGFRHVIGTLWEVMDDMCVEMATLTYKELCKGEMTDESVSLGLHKATRTLRDGWVGRRSQTRSARKRKRNASLSLESNTYDQESAPGLVSADNTRHRDIDDMEEDGDVAAPWVPYIHFGP